MQRKRVFLAEFAFLTSIHSLLFCSFDFLLFYLFYSSPHKMIMIVQLKFQHELISASRKNGHYELSPIRSMWTANRRHCFHFCYSWFCVNRWCIGDHEWPKRWHLPKIKSVVPSNGANNLTYANFVNWIYRSENYSFKIKMLSFDTVGHRVHAMRKK